MYNIGDKIVHPMHGAGTIAEIKTETVNGSVREYYILNLTGNNMKLMVPVDSSDKVGLRDVISSEKADELLSLAATLEIEEIQNWNQRYRDNAAKIKSGSLEEILRVIKSLMYRDLKNGLSTGERKMLHSAKQIILSELVLAKGMAYSEIELIIDNSLSPSSK